MFFNRMDNNYFYKFYNIVIINFSSSDREFRKYPRKALVNLFYQVYGFKTLG